MIENRSRAWLALVILFAVNTLNFFDRQILGAVGEAVRKEWGLSDGALGALGTAFTLLYAFVGVPFGRLADRRQRTRILVGGVLVWSLLTAASGLARNFWQLFMLRLGVGVGEASCAPAAASLIGDLFPPEKRARALSVFMLGLPVGLALSFSVSGALAKAYGWRAAFFIAGLPGIACAAAAFFLLREPVRGAAEAHPVGARQRAGSPYRLILGTPTMRWLIVSGALHNFNMYALGAFITPLLMRYHKADIATANYIATAIYGVTGTPGLLLGGIVGDALARKRTNGRLLLSAAAVLAAIPFFLLALARGRGEIFSFALLLGLACALMYFYYATIYSTIQDVIEPALRGTAMAVYFFAMYVLGASFGSFALGATSDFFTARAARATGVFEVAPSALEPFRADGLHTAMYIIPIFTLLLSAVLFAAARAAPRDIEALRRWMREPEKSRD